MRASACSQAGARSAWRRAQRAGAETVTVLHENRCHARLISPTPVRTCMAHETAAMLRIALPTNVACKGSATGADAHEHVRTYLADVGGGWTEYEARGGWENDDGELVRERVRMYECAITGREGTPKNARVHGHVLADELAFITTEDTVMWQVVADGGVWVGFES